MAKRIQVGGRIESKEVGGIVTGAAEILDDAKEKKQSVINQETDDELARLDQSKQDNLTFDNAPTEDSDNPVKSGGVYAAQQAILLAIAAINELIPSAASALNQLADKAFVNSSISTNTATFRGTSAAGLNEQQFLAWANGLEHDLNDYVFWQTSDAAGNTLFKRYKWNGTEWAYEYTLNNSTFTAEQWEAIQSGITALLVAKLRALPTAQELIQSFDSKQDVLTFDDAPILGSTNPVKSSGIYNAIDGEKERAETAEQGLSDLIDIIQALIPAEATAQNQLADKADVAAKIVAAIPSWKGQYDALTDLQAVTGAKAGDMGCVKTTDSDGHPVLTFYQYSAQGAWVVYYVLRHYAQNKPATTGTTGDYAYNGMGRIELQKNLVNGVNTLTQAMLTQQNTIYVIQYDYTLTGDVTVPDNCVLEFEGGSISGAYTITGSNTGINAGLVKIFNTNVIFSGSWSIKGFCVEWFGAIGDNATDCTVAINKSLENASNTNVQNVYIGNGNFVVTSTIYLRPAVHLIGNRPVGKDAWAYGNGTRLIANFSNDKSWIVDCYVIEYSTNQQLAYNREINGSFFDNSLGTTCFNTGIQNLSILRKENSNRVYGAIRMINASGYVRKNITLVDCAYNGCVADACFDGIDEEVRCLNISYVSFAYILDTHNISNTDCCSGMFDVVSTFNTDYIIPSVSTTYSTTETYSMAIYTYYTRGIEIRSFGDDGRKDIGTFVISSNDVVVSTYWAEGQRVAVFGVEGTDITLQRCFCNLGENVLYLKSKGYCTIVDDSDTDLSKMRFSAYKNEKLYAPSYNYTVDATNTLSVLNEYPSQIKERLEKIIINDASGFVMPVDTPFVIPQGNELIIAGNNKTISIGGRYHAFLSTTNRKVTVKDLTINISDGSVSSAFATIINLVTYIFNNCTINLSNSYCSVIDGISTFNYVGIADVCFNGCTINASNGGNLSNTAIKINNAVFINTTHTDLAMPVVPICQVG